MQTLDGSYESEEIERSIIELNLSIKLNDLIEMFNNAPQITLEKNIWKILDNTDFNVKTRDEVKQKLIDYGRDPLNYDSIVSEIKRGIWYPPLILKLPNNKYYLVSGNTRLIVSKVLGIRPIVKIVSLI